MVKGGHAVVKVSEFAKQAGVTPKTVYKWLNRLNPIYQNGLSGKKDGITYITEEGATVLTYALTGGVTGAETEETMQVNAKESAQIEYLQEQNKILLEELNREREHSRTMAEQLAEIARNNQVLLGIEQRRVGPAILEEGEEHSPKKPGFWKKIFG